MFSFRDRKLGLAALALAVLTAGWSAPAEAQGKPGAKPSAPATAAFPGIGRAATPAEVRAWDIDVRGDFAGLPKGSGSVAKGQEVWDAKCASCHGVFGESNEVFPPIVGGTTKKDSETGRVAALVEGFNAPQRTTLMKLSNMSALWDYINRAMPWNAPKTLTVEEVYGVTAYILNLGNIVPDNFVLSDQNIVQVQATLPNRNGKVAFNGMWLVRGKPDVQGSACVSNCAVEPKVASLIPDYARDAHGNLAEQNRGFGNTRGADTTRPATVKVAVGSAVSQAAQPSAAAQTVAALTSAPPASPAAGASPAAPPAPAGADSAAVLRLAQRYTCTACHGVDNKLVGPSFRQIADKHKGRADATDYLAGKIRNGAQGGWGAIPMPPQPNVPVADVRLLAEWLAAGARR